MKLHLERREWRRFVAECTALQMGKRLAALVFLLFLAASVPTQATAGAWPNLLDDNRSGLYGPAAQALLQLLLPFACPPIVCKVQAGGRVVPHPRIVNLYWDDNWDAHNPGSPTRAEINAYVQLLTASEYLDGAAQYGVGRGTFHSEHGSSTLCQTMRPTAPNGQPASHTNPGTMNLSSLVGWFTCEVENSFFTGVPLPDNDTIYTVLLPEGVTITGQPGATCNPTAAFHIFSALFLPNTDPDLLLGVTLKLVAVPIIVIPAECVLHSAHSDTVDEFTTLFSHELVEAAFDPVPPTGWIDNSRSSDLVDWTNNGEPADICQSSTLYADVITTAVRMPFGVMVDRYWSNEKGECVPTGDTTPPVVGPEQTTGTLGSGGWYSSDVTVRWDPTDTLSRVSSRLGCDGTTIAADTSGTTLTCTATSAGGTTASSVTIKRDATAPLIHYSGNAGSYSFNHAVSISCAASDALSGVSSTTCADVSGPASSFGLGTTTLSASATDLAGNTGTGSTSFTVVVTPPDVGPIVNPANGHRYYLLAPATWADAESDAVALGGHLVTVVDADENAWVWETFAPSSSGSVWIGLSDAAQEGTFVWTSGEPATYLNWWTEGGQPSNGGGIENYAEMNNYVWNDNTGVAILHGVVEVVPEPAAAGAWAALATLALRWRRRDNSRSSV